MTSWSQPFTVKSNARRAARKAGVDPARVEVFVKAGAKLYRFPQFAEKPAPAKAKTAKPTKTKRASRAAQLRKVAGKPINALAAATSKPRNFKAPKPAKPPKSAAPRESSGGKAAQVAAMLREPGGASITAVTAATGWKAHSARARISVDVTKLLAANEVIERRREDGVSHYAIVKSKQMDLPGIEQPEAA